MREAGKIRELVTRVVTQDASGVDVELSLASGIKTSAAELSMRPTTTVRVEGDAARKLLGLVETLEDLDDVIKVHANFDVPEEVLQHA
mgnify:CR=1 FL=1